MGWRQLNAWSRASLLLVLVTHYHGASGSSLTQESAFGLLSRRRPLDDTSTGSSQVSPAAMKGPPTPTPAGSPEFPASACVEDLGEDDVKHKFQLHCPKGSVIAGFDWASFGQQEASCATGSFERSGCSRTYGLQDGVDRNVFWFLMDLCIGKQQCSFKHEHRPHLASMKIRDILGFSARGCWGRLTLAVRAKCSKEISGEVDHTTAGHREGPTTKSSNRRSLPGADRGSHVAMGWSSSRKFNEVNFNATKELLTVMYELAGNEGGEGKEPKDIVQKLAAMGINLKSRHTRMLVTYERKFNNKWFGMTTAWFGVVAKLPLENTIVVPIRGTLTSTEWVYDADYASVPLPDQLVPSWVQQLEDESRVKKMFQSIRLHRGFHDLYMGLRDLLITAVKGFETNPSVLVTGHSLGSAIATLAAFDLAAQGVPILSVYTFASPRVGNSAFAEAYDLLLSRSNGDSVSVNSNVPSYRIANNADVVTLLPHPILNGGGGHHFMHVSGTKYTFEFIPWEGDVPSMSSGEFAGWAHNLQTYQTHGLKLLPFDSDE